LGIPKSPTAKYLNWERWKRERYLDRRGEDRRIREKEIWMEEDVQPERYRDYLEERDFRLEHERDRY